LHSKAVKKDYVIVQIRSNSFQLSSTWSETKY